MKIFKMETPYAIVYLLITIVIPPLFIINLVLLLIQYVVNNRENFNQCKNETSPIVKDLINETNEKIKEIDNDIDNTNVKNLLLANHFVINSNIEFIIPNGFYILTTKNVKLDIDNFKFFIYQKQDKENLIELKKIDNIKSFEEYTKNSNIEEKNVYYYKNSKMRKIIFEEEVIIERFLKNTIYIISGLKENEKIMESLIKSIKTANIVNISYDEEVKIYKFCKAIENYSEQKMRLTNSFLNASNNNMISKELLLRLYNEIENDYLLQTHSLYTKYHYNEILRVLIKYKYF